MDKDNEIYVTSNGELYKKGVEQAIYPQTNYTTQQFYTKEEYDKLQAENDNLKDDIDKQQLYVDSLEQENEELINKLICESVKVRYVYSTTNQYTMNEVAELKAENDRLKEENEHYRKEAYRLADGLNKTENLAFTYKQALQEIRDIVREETETRMLFADEKSFCDFCKIQAKINEVIGAEE